MEKRLVQITAARGPIECCRVVARVQGLMIQHAKKSGIAAVVMNTTAGPRGGTLQSTTLEISGQNLDAYIAEWQGTLQWVAQSPYRKTYLRKNWFVGVAFFEVPEPMEWDARDVRIVTCRASGPGGQNVNKVETAVRATHLPSGIQVLASESRSQLENKHLCLERLRAKVAGWNAGQAKVALQDRWEEHNELQRGNPVKVIVAAL